MRLIRTVVAALAVMFAFGAIVGTASADDVDHASEAAKLSQQANQKVNQAKKKEKKAKQLQKKAKRLTKKANKLNKKCKKRKAKAKKKCKRQVKKLKKQAKKARNQVKKLKKQAKKLRNQAKNLRNQAADHRQQLADKPPVTIRTTEYGIPRIVADSWRGLGYGYGYSLAKENICSMADIYTTIRGERSKYFGPDGRWMLTGNGQEYSNLEADFSHKRLIVEGAVDKVLAMDPPNGPRPEARQAVDGYVKGYNAWLEEVGGADGIQDVTCKGEPWVKPITVEDAYLRFLELGSMAGEGVAVDGMVNAEPPAGGGSVDGVDPASPESAKGFTFKQPEIGSNAVALGSDVTSTGKGMLYGNPHFPWMGSERFFDAQLTIPGEMNSSGGSLLGVPVVLIGHTDTMAWSHTVSTARRFNLFQERLVPGKPTWYYHKGVEKEMEATEVTVDVLQPDDSIQSETRTLYRTVHGPVTTSLQGQNLFAWSPTYAFTIFDANANAVRFINYFFGANMAHSVDDMMEVLTSTMGVPWVNTIAADSEGNALYADIGSVPNLTDERVAECAAPFNSSTWPLMKVAVLDSSVNDCDMQKAPGSPATGILPAEQMPHQIRRDYESNMNDSYWLSNPNAPLEGFPSIIGDEGTTRSLRTRNGLHQIEQRLEGKAPDGTVDGRGNKFTPEIMREFITNNFHYGGYAYIPPLVDWCNTQGDPVLIEGVDVTEACDALAGWDLSEKIDSEGSYLARRVITRVNGVSGRWDTGFNVADPINTPFNLKTSLPAVLTAFKTAVTDLTSRGIDMDATIGEYQFVVKAGDVFPIPGGNGGLGMFNVISSGMRGNGNYDMINHGSSFIQMAELDGSQCPDVKTILTYSQAATNELSPFYKDQTELFSNSGWVDDRFCSADQLASPGLDVNDLNGGSWAIKRGEW